MLRCASLLSPETPVCHNSFMKLLPHLLAISVTINIALASLLMLDGSEPDVVQPEVIQTNSCEKYNNDGGIAEWTGYYESLQDLKERSELVVVATVVDCGVDPEELVADLGPVL